MKYRISLFLIFVGYYTYAQRPKAAFGTDSLIIGKPISLSLTFLSNGKTDLLFPDSTNNFSPFQLVDIEYFPTKTQNGKSLDSVVYKIITFKVDSNYSLVLPVKNLRTGQTIFSDTARVKLHSSLNKADLSNHVIKKSTGYFNVPLDFNFPKFLYSLVILLVSFAVFWAMFGKLILRNIKLWQFNQKQQKFTSAYKKLSKNPKNFSNIGAGLILWKNHLEWLLRKPFSTMTTSEISKTLENDRLEEALKEFDLAIYGGVLSDHVPFAFNILFDYASDTFKKQRKQYKEALKRT
jgi:hypothetical protein